MLLFNGDSPEVKEKFARADPYVTSGVVKGLARTGMDHRRRK